MGHFVSPRRTGGEPLSPHSVRHAVRQLSRSLAAALPPRERGSWAGPAVRSGLAMLFFLYSHMGMDRIDTARVAETLLAAPGWARVGLTVPTAHMRVEAAFELDRKSVV